jgi:hypothetical protein
MPKQATNDEIFSLHRYFMWANRMRTHFDEKVPVVVEQINNQGPDMWTDELIEANLYMSYWYGGLYVVVEGWQQLRLADTTVDGLLASPNVELLKRYRHGVFHYQKNYFDKRFMDFMTQGQNITGWVRDLNRAFGGYFLDWHKARKQERDARNP